MAKSLPEQGDPKTMHQPRALQKQDSFYGLSLWKMRFRSGMCGKIGRRSTRHMKLDRANEEKPETQREEQACNPKEPRVSKCKTETQKNQPASEAAEDHK